MVAQSATCEPALTGAVTTLATVRTHPVSPSSSNGPANIIALFIGPSPPVADVRVSSIEDMPDRRHRKGGAVVTTEYTHSK
ncbi:MAG TPA: hypothetical protein DHB48_06805 [Sphingobium sp.]|nr:hypothetical protein [Sphingobium sp.]